MKAWSGWTGRRGLFILFILALLVLVGCQSGGDSGEGSGTIALKPGFESDAELESYLKQQFADSLQDFSVLSTDVVGMGGMAGDGTGGAESEGQRQHSGTNLQEAGVDEADKVKTDGNHLFMARQDGVRVLTLEADPAVAPLAHIETDGPVASLYLYQSLLVVLYRPLDFQGSDWCGMMGVPSLLQDAPGSMPCWIPSRAKSGVLLVDVHNPAAPLRLAEKVFDGELVSSRRIGGKLHLVSRFLPQLPPLEYGYGAGAGSREEVRQRNRRAMASLSLDELLPFLEHRDGSGNVLRRGRLVDGRNFLRPELPHGGSILTVSTLDLDDPQVGVRTVGAVLDARHLYATPDSLYLAAQSWTQDGGRTLLHKFDLSAGEALYAASGSVPGTLLNQFSLGEHEGVLRVATATGGGWVGGMAANHVFCLKQQAEDLVVAGSLENLAPGERLYAARFMGGRGYLVTFLQVDPLFTLDLSDPANPRLVGELKVPGYSEYLHPLGNDYLLAIGKGVQVDGGVALYQGVQLSMFDLRDFANPALLYRQDIGDRGTESAALRDHRAFGYWAEEGLLAVPVDLSEHLNSAASPWEFGQRVFTGVYVYRVDPLTGFQFLGRLGAPADAVPMFSSYPWLRGVFAGASVYAVGESAVYSGLLSDLEGSQRVLSLAP